jgi:hypothetical protein
MFTKNEVIKDFTCPECHVSLLSHWYEAAPEAEHVTCSNGHDTGKTVGSIRQELLRIGMLRVQSILSGRADRLPHQA